jgi:hypothetical protein
LSVPSSQVDRELLDCSNDGCSVIAQTELPLKTSLDKISPRRLG